MGPHDDPSYKPRLGIKTGNVEYGNVEYDIVDDPQKSFWLVNTSMSDTITAHVQLSSLQRDLKWYLAHKAFNFSPNFLTMHYFDVSQSIAVVRKIDYNLNGWLKKKLVQYSEEGQCSTWWECIKADFRSIFAPFISAIRELHERGKFHGDIMHGIAIDEEEEPNKVQGFLFDMVDQPKELTDDDLQLRQKKDVRDLIQLIHYTLDYHFKQTVPHEDRRRRLGPPLPLEIEKCCLIQLRHI